MNAFMGILCLFFWAAVLAFVPTTFYLLIKNPPLYKAESLTAKGIFILHAERSRKSRIKTVGIIYAACLAFFVFIYVFNSRHQIIGVRPFDILSTLSVIFFWISMLTYLPIALYLILKNPWQYKEEGVCLTAIYIFYGVCILMFSGIFAFQWLKSHHLPVTTGEVLWSLWVVLWGAVVLSYLPTLLYVYGRVVRPGRHRPVHPNTIFVIYSACFLIFSTMYILDWIGDRRAGVPYVSWIDLLRFR